MKSDIDMFRVERKSTKIYNLENPGVLHPKQCYKTSLKSLLLQ
jgi:hypothetical protein